jgi:hypothetical protein
LKLDENLLLPVVKETKKEWGCDGVMECSKLPVCFEGVGLWTDAGLVNGWNEMSVLYYCC